MWSSTYVTQNIIDVNASIIQNSKIRALPHADWISYMAIDYIQQMDKVISWSNWSGTDNLNINIKIQ